MDLAVRPQPLGIFPLPAGYLILPSAPGVSEVQAALLHGMLPDSLPDSLRFYALAVQGDLEAALAALHNDTTTEGRYNRFVLRSDPADYAGLRAELQGDLLLLLDLTAYTLGWLAVPPEPGESTGEVRASILSAQAAHALEQDAVVAAERALDAAVAAARPVSPVLAAQLLSDLAETRRQQRGLDSMVLQYEREALRLLEGSGLSYFRAQLALKLATRYHELAHGQRGPLLEAVKFYQEALQVLTRESAPELYALAQNNLALAYLAMPMVEASDQLRMGIAVQALREALRVYTRDEYAAEWASAQLNLANALQYLPSSHPKENLAEAVQLYEEVLQARDPVSDPLGYARLLANQANAFAHLGIFVHARPKLHEALRLFTVGGDTEGAATVRAALKDIERLALQESDGSIPAPTV